MLLEGRCQKGWRLMSLSTDAKKVLVVMGAGINSVNLEKSEIRRLPARFATASLSPDATTIAATDRQNDQKLFVIDPNDFSVRRELRWHDGEDPRWSPDGRYLLRGKTQFYCFATNFSLDVDAPHTPILVDVESGRTKALGHARCRYEKLTGWINTAKLGSMSDQNP